MKAARSNSRLLYLLTLRGGKKKKKFKEVMFLSQSALQNILGRHGNPWQAAIAWPASVLNFSEELNT